LRPDICQGLGHESSQDYHLTARLRFDISNVQPSLIVSTSALLVPSLTKCRHLLGLPHPQTKALGHQALDVCSTTVKFLSCIEASGPTSFIRPSTRLIQLHHGAHLFTSPKGPWQAEWHWHPASTAQSSQTDKRPKYKRTKAIDDKDQCHQGEHSDRERPWNGGLTRSQARNLAPKDKSGTSDPVCLLNLLQRYGNASITSTSTPTSTPELPLRTASFLPSLILQNILISHSI
jgi:hypothetical protein